MQKCKIYVGSHSTNKKRRQTLSDTSGNRTKHWRLNKVKSFIKQEIKNFYIKSAEISF